VKSRTLRTFIEVHTWVGLFSGFALFIAFYAGSLTVFTHELQEWDDVSSWSSPADSPQSIQRLVDATSASHPAMREFGLLLPGEHGPHAVLYWFEERPGEAREEHEFRLRNGQLTQGPATAQLASFIYRLHYTAGLPASWGIYVLGLVSVLYGVALATGVIVYAPGFVRDLFALRVGGSLKRLWQDAHNVVGVLSLPFHLIFAWSGGVLCLGLLLFVPFQYFVFDDKLSKIVGPDIDVVESAPAAHVSEPMIPVAELLERARQVLPGLDPDYIFFTQAGDANAQATIYGSMAQRRLSSLGGVALDANTGALLRAVEPDAYSPGAAFYRGLVSLHFAEFGRMAVRWLYFLLGMAGAFLFYSGNLLWIEARRNRRGAQQTRGSRFVAQLTLGVCLGCIAGISAAFVASRLAPEAWGGPASAVEIAYFATFFASIAWSLLRPPSRAANELLIACALLTVLIPFANAWTAGMPPWRSVAEGRWIVLTVDTLCVSFAWMFWRMSAAVRYREVHGDRNSLWALPGARASARLRKL